MKMQLPPIGGVRKVLKQNAQQSGGTTIAEIGNNTVTLEQLAALIFNLLTNAGTVNTGGQGQSAVLIPGPGLGGGGSLIGNVPLYLTAPISPYSLEDGSVDNDVGMIVPGPAGPRGPQGIPGQFLMPEDGADGDWGPPGAQGPAGATGATGPQGPAGTGTGSGGTGTLMMFVPEDPTDNDVGFLVPGPQGVQGPIGATGPQGPAGSGSGSSAGLTMWIPEDTSYEDHIPNSPPASLTLPYLGIFSTLAFLATASITASGPKASLTMVIASALNIVSSGSQIAVFDRSCWHIVYTDYARRSYRFAEHAVSSPGNSQGIFSRAGTVGQV